MRYTDVAIVGGGLAGSTAAAMLGRAGIAAILIDPHTVYPPDLRCEKLGGDSSTCCARPALPMLRCVRPRSTARVWIARFGYCVAKKPSDQYGVLYDTLVNAVRAQIPPDVETIHAKVIVDLQQSGAAEDRAVERRGNLGAAGRASPTA